MMQAFLFKIFLRTTELEFGETEKISNFDQKKHFRNVFGVGLETGENLRKYKYMSKLRSPTGQSVRALDS